MNARPACRPAAAGLPLLVVLLIAWAAPAAGASAYHYPLEDPLAATVIGTPTAFQAVLPEGPVLAARQLPPPAVRPVPAVLDYARPLYYGFAAQAEPAALVYVIAGTGGSALGATSRLLARILHAAGFHVVTLPSPTRVSFLLNAARHPVPGRMSTDVRDLYRMLRQVDERVSDTVEVTQRHLAGYSLGATQAAFLARHDEAAGALGFRRVLLIDPAVSVYHSVGRLDALLLDGLPHGINDLPAFLADTMAQLRHVYDAGDALNFETDTLYRAYLKARPDHQNLAGMIGLAFRLSLANMAFAADLITRRGAIVPADTQLDIDDSLEPYLMRAISMSFSEYVDQLLLPYHQARDAGLSRAALIAEGDLRRIAGYLRSNPDIGVVVNRDDPILGPRDLAFLEATFGTRARVYPRGGHLGNIGQRQTARAIQRFMRGAKH